MASLVLALGRGTYREWLERRLRTGHRLLSGEQLDAELANASDEIDLVVADLPGLRRFGSAIEACRRKAEPARVPVLLLLARRSLQRARQRPVLRLVDDVLVTPLAPAEVAARVENLLRLRRLSKRQSAAAHSAQAALHETSRALRALSACNDAVSRASSESELLTRVCQVIVEEAEYRMAWVGYVTESPQRDLRMMASAGHEVGYLNAISLSVGTDPLGQGPVGRAVRSARPAVSRDVARDPRFKPWRSAALERGYSSVIALPLRIGSAVMGVLAIYSSERESFDASERALLSRMADTLVHGIRALREHVERRRSEAQYAYMAQHDTLTGLPNRTLLRDTIERLTHDERRPKYEAAVLFIDLDGFKLINDGLGHAAGDQLLCEAAARFKGLVRGGDLVARAGADEFVVLLAHQPAAWETKDPEGIGRQLPNLAARVARRVLEALERPFVIGGAERYLGASIGVALFPHDAAEGAELLARAHEAMYFAKAFGGRQYRFYARELSKRQQRRLALETELHRAIQRKEFALHYQPIVELESGRVTGVEALVRWPRENGPWIPPGEFIPVAEETGLIVAIGDWVVRTACDAARAWRAEGLDLTVAVNLSVRQFWEKGLVDRLQTLVAQAGIPPHVFRIEVTEGAMVVDPERMSWALARLHDFGFRVALDDFGTGYSSLSRLAELPITTLKIDQSFVGRLPGSERAKILVAALCQLARNLGMETVAEGIETEPQRDFLRSVGCERGQGYLFSYPMPLDEMIAHVRRSSSTEEPRR